MHRRFGFRRGEHDDEREHRRHHHHPRRGPWDEHGFAFGPRRGPFRGGPHGGHRGGPFDEPPGDEGPPRRQRRGDIRYALLEVISEQPRHGYDVIKALEERYGGFYRPSPGSVYPTLQMLEDAGFLVSETTGGKRVYTITEAGLQQLAEWRQQRDQAPEEHWRGFHGNRDHAAMRALRERGGALMSSLSEIARHGTPEQVQAATALLDETRRKLYSILATGPASSNEQGEEQ